MNNIKAKRLNNKQQGAAAIFTVLFFTLLMSVVTIGFVQIMLRDQEQSLDDDLARSALNSAESGVEDAKRIVSRYNQACADSSRAEECDAYRSAISASGDSCDAIMQSRITSDLGLNLTSQGIQVSDTAELAQYYTCLNITLDTIDYIRKLNDQQSDLIPLKSTRDFNRVVINWFNRQDTGNLTVSLPPAPRAGIFSLPERSAWATNNRATPPIMRVQLISYDRNGFTIDSLDGNSTRTLFLYPQSVGTGTASFDLDQRTGTYLSGTTQKQNIVGIDCDASATYVCQANLNIPNSLLQGGSREFFLRVTPLYAASTFTLQMSNTSQATPEVRFAGVQPEVDSTGKANDVFRRISARIRSDIGDYPENSLETSNPLCKDMLVTNNASDYTSTASCTPVP